MKPEGQDLNEFAFADKQFLFPNRLSPTVIDHFLSYAPHFIISEVHVIGSGDGGIPFESGTDVFNGFAAISGGPLAQIRYFAYLQWEYYRPPYRLLPDFAYGV